jgi:hypothetical protein
MAQRFSEELGLPVLPYYGDNWIPGTPFAIDGDIVIAIAFNGEPPWPTQRQRHAHVPQNNFLLHPWPYIASANGNFALRRDSRDNVPEEWLEIFGNIDDRPGW